MGHKIQQIPLPPVVPKTCVFINTYTVAPSVSQKKPGERRIFVPQDNKPSTVLTFSPNRKL